MRRTKFQSKTTTQTITKEYWPTEYYIPDSNMKNLFDECLKNDIKVRKITISQYRALSKIDDQFKLAYLLLRDGKLFNEKFSLKHVKAFLESVGRQDDLSEENCKIIYKDIIKLDTCNSGLNDLAIAFNDKLASDDCSIISKFLGHLLGNNSESISTSTQAAPAPEVASAAPAPKIASVAPAPKVASAAPAPAPIGRDDQFSVFDLDELNNSLLNPSSDLDQLNNGLSLMGHQEEKDC